MWPRSEELNGTERGEKEWVKLGGNRGKLRLKAWSSALTVEACIQKLGERVIDL